MAFPQVQSITETITSSTTSHAVDMPVTVNAGDLLLMIIRCQSAVITAAPSGWSILYNDAQNPLYIKKAAGTEGGGTAVVTTSSTQIMVTQVYRITGWRDSGTILNDVEYATASGSSTDPNPPSLNPTNWDAEDTLWIACVAFGTGGVSAYPASYTGGVWTNTTPAKVATARRERNVATEDPGTFTTTISTTWQAHTVAIRPASIITLTAPGAQGLFSAHTPTVRRIISLSAPNVQLFAAHVPSVPENLSLSPPDVQTFSAHLPSLIYDKQLGVGVTPQFFSAHLPLVNRDILHTPSVQFFSAFLPSLLYSKSVSPGLYQLFQHHSPVVEIHFSPTTIFNTDTDAFSSVGLNADNDFVRRDRNE